MRSGSARSRRHISFSFCASDSAYVSAVSVPAYVVMATRLARKVTAGPTGIIGSRRYWCARRGPGGNFNSSFIGRRHGDS